MIDLPRGKLAKEKVEKPVHKSRFPPAPTPWSVYDPNAEVCREHGIKFRPVYITDANGDHICCVGTTEIDLANAELIVRAVNNLKGISNDAR